MEPIQFTVQPCWLGHALIAATETGICAIALGDTAESLTTGFKTQFPKADLIESDRAFAISIEPILEFIESPKPIFPAALDLQGTDFQRTVWQALQAIAPGQTLTYGELAQRLGNPKSVRAVANACGKNKIAIAIPCHRVIGSDGSLRGYRWGEDRKRLLLDRENQKNPTSQPRGKDSDRRQLRLFDAVAQ